MTIEQIWSVFTEIEARENLVSWRIGSIFLWPIIRASLMREVAEKLGVFEPRPKQSLVSDGPREAAPVKIVSSSYAVVPFVRRNVSGLDPFSAYIIDSLSANGENPLILGMGPDDIGSGRPQVEQLEREFLSRHRTFAKFMVAPTLRPAHSAKYARVIEYIETSLAEVAADGGVLAENITGAYRTFPRWLLVDFYAQRKGWAKFFRASKVRKVFIVNAWKRAMIAGAQEAGASVVEPMHGAVSDIHPYLTWAGQDWVAYQPDELLEWGNYWGEVADLPTVTKRTVVGAPQAIIDAVVREKELTLRGEAHLPNTVLVASQAHATQKITEFLLAAAEAHPGFTFILKQHAQESPIDFAATAEDTFEKGCLATSRVPPNLILADPKSDTLDLMARSEFVLGVYTTALFEALAVGCRVGVLAFSGWHHVRSLVDHKGAQLIANQTDLDSFLGFSGVGASCTNIDFYYAAPLSKSELWAAIKIAE